MAPHAASAALLLALASLVYAPLLSIDNAPSAAFSDVPVFHVAMKEALAQGLAVGELPLWNSDQMLGRLALTQPQALYLHPLHILFWFLSPARAVGLTLFFSMWVCGLGAYALAQTLGTSRPSALLAGAAQLVCFKYILACYAGWLAPLATLVMLPWLAASWIALAQRADFRSWFQLSLVFAVCLACGLPQSLFYLLLLLLAYPLLAVPVASGTRLRHASRVYALAAGSLVLGFACNAYMWLPILAELPLVSRASQSYEVFMSGHALRLEHLATWFYPELLGSPLDRSYPGLELWEDVAYFGLVPFLFALSLFPRVGRLPRAVRYLLAAFAASAVLSLSSPLLELVFTLVPGYRVFRLPGRMLFVTSVLGIALFAIALDLLLHKLGSQRRRTQRALLAVLALAVLGEGALYVRRYLQPVAATELEAPSDHPARRLSDSHMRTAIVGRGTFNYGWATGMKLQLVNGFDPYNFVHVRDYMALVEQGREGEGGPANFLDLRALERPDLLAELSVKHVLARKPLTHPALRLVARHPNVRNFVFYKGERREDLFEYQLEPTLPRARFAREAVILGSLRDVAARLAEGPLDGRGLVLQGPSAGVPGAAAPTDQVSETSRVSGSIALRVDTREPRLLVLSEAFHPGWRAQIDGQRVPLLQTNLALLGVWVPPGQHAVKVRFEPLHFALAVWLSVLALSLLALCALLQSARLRGPILSALRVNARREADGA